MCYFKMLTDFKEKKRDIPLLAKDKFASLLEIN